MNFCRLNHAEKLGLEVRLHQCEHCGKEFKTTSNLKWHMNNSHSDKGPDPKYKCHICSAQLKQDNSYRKHMAHSHGIGEKCDICNKLYVSKAALEKHQKKVHVAMQGMELSNGV